MAMSAARVRIARLVAQMRPTGRVLEIACGTGLWTEALAGLADTVTAIDAAPEMVEIAGDRVRSAKVSFAVVDVFSWDPDARFDVIFFSAWLSHVPMSRVEPFWQSLRGLLAENGRVLFIDEHVDQRGGRGPQRRGHGLLQFGVVTAAPDQATAPAQRFGLKSRVWVRPEPGWHGFRVCRRRTRVWRMPKPGMHPPCLRRVYQDQPGMPGLNRIPFSPTCTRPPAPFLNRR
jgi:SAM-dependent methyltransferase